MTAETVGQQRAALVTGGSRGIGAATCRLAAERGDAVCLNIRVNAVRPGFIYTDIHASGGELGRVDRVKGFVPMKRGGQPEEVATVIRPSPRYRASWLDLVIP